jgi:hypothetical protein
MTITTILTIAALAVMAGLIIGYVLAGPPPWRPVNRKGDRYVDRPDR